MFTDVLREETAHLGLPAVGGSTTRTEDGLAGRVKYLFGL
jgi:hypothetical protein